MANAIKDRDIETFQKEANKMKKGNRLLPNCIDGIVGSNLIANRFKDRYGKILNDVGYQLNEMNELEADLDKLISRDNEVKKINFQQMKFCIDRLKFDKSEESGLFTIHIKYGTYELCIHFTFLYNVMLSHGTSTDELLAGIMIPLIKDKRKSHHDSDNYRALTIGTILA